MATSTYSDGRDAEQRQVEDEPERRLRSRRRSRHGDERDHERRQHRAESDPARDAERSYEQCAQAQVGADRGRRRALGLEVEQLASVVADVTDDGQQQPDQRQQECDRCGAGERQQRTSGQWIRTQLGQRVGPRVQRQLGERRLRKGRRGRGLAARRNVDPELVGDAEPGRASVEDRRRVRAVCDDHVAVNGREPLQRADDPRCDLLPFDLQRDDPVRAGLGDHARRRQYGQRHTVGRLGRPEDTVLIRGEDVAEPRRAAGDPAGPDPAGERRTHEFAVDARRAEGDLALRARLQAEPAVRGQAPAVQDVEPGAAPAWRR